MYARHILNFIFIFVFVTSKTLSIFIYHLCAPIIIPKFSILNIYLKIVKYSIYN